MFQIKEDHGMKKLVCVLLALAVCLGLGASAVLLPSIKG